MDNYNLAIIGGGPAGYSAALQAARNGLHVILFEKDLIGGTCLNRGCVPTKYFLDFSKRVFDIKNISERGLTVGNVLIDYEKTQSEKNALVSKLRINLEQFIKSSNITIINKHCDLISPGLLVAENVQYHADNILISTGSHERIINDSYHSSDDVLSLRDIPHKVNIIGGGVIAVEFAAFFAMLGVETSIFTRSNRILKKWDKEVSLAVSQSLRKKGVSINYNCDLYNLSFPDDEYTICAIGRIPNSEKTPLYDVDGYGGIVVDDNYETKTKGIYAVGDVLSGSHMLAHEAIEQGKKVADIISLKGRKANSYIVNCIYLDIEVASVGEDELTLHEKGYDVLVSKINLASNARTSISTKERSFIKIVVDKTTHTILGATLVCERATDIVDELLLAMNNKLTIEDLLINTRPHPSYCEILTDLFEETMKKL